MAIDIERWEVSETERRYHTDAELTDKCDPMTWSEEGEGRVLDLTRSEEDLIAGIISNMSVLTVRLSSNELGVTVKDSGDWIKTEARILALMCRFTGEEEINFYESPQDLI